MMKRYLLILAIIVVVGALIYIHMLPLPASSDPFGNTTLGAEPNCDKEYRFKFNERVESENEFIQFLKNHQFNGSLVDYRPTEDKLIPEYTTQNLLDLDKLRGNVTVENSNVTNEKIYSVIINNAVFNESYPWRVAVRVSETGYVSIRYCAGI